MKLFNYDDGNIISIIEYAKKLENKTFRDITEAYIQSEIKQYYNPTDFPPIDAFTSFDVVKVIKNAKAKGQLGNLIEQLYFGYKPNNKQEPDFPKVELELKQTCIDKKKKEGFKAGERLSITMVDFSKEVEEDFYKSHVWKKIKQMLLIHYLRDKEKDRLDYEIKYVNLFQPPKEDLLIIEQDYKKIIQKIKEGRAHELSEGDTMYLGACTKGATAEKSLTTQFYNPDIPAKSRNFCFKQSYMNHVLNKYVLPNKVPFESIVKDSSDLTNQTFEDYVLSLLNKHIGKSDKELCKEFNRQYNNNKAQWSDLAYRMLGIKGNHAEEFVKANIVVKTIRVEENNHIKESMSLPAFKFKELVQETWEESDTFEYFSTTKFLFVVFRKKGDCYYLEKSMFWNVPYDVLDTIIQDTWNRTKEIILNGVQFTIKSNGVFNNFPGMSDNGYVHVRPHSQKSAYKLNNGFEKGNIIKDANELPNGEWMTTQCFWFNNSYIEEIVSIRKK